MTTFHQRVKWSLRTDWLSSLAFDSAAYERSLLDLGLNERLVKPDVDAYRKRFENLWALRPREGPPAAAAPEGFEKWEKQRESFIGAIKDLVARREYRVEDSVLRQIKVALFWLTCPDVKRSSVQYSQESAHESTAGFCMTVFGTGMGAEQEVSITYMSEFEASEGQYKTIFVHFPLQVSLVEVYEKGVLVGKGLRSEVPVGRQNEFTLGIELESAEGGHLARRNADLAEEFFDLAGDTSESIHAFSRTEGAKLGIEIKSGLKAFDFEVSSKIKLDRFHETKLTFNLPAGRNYRLMRYRNGMGVWWS